MDSERRAEDGSGKDCNCHQGKLSEEDKEIHDEVSNLMISSFVELGSRVEVCVEFEVFVLLEDRIKVPRIGGCFK